MQPLVALPTPADVWTGLGMRIETALREQRSEIMELSGIHTEFGPPGEGFTGDLEADQFINELSGAQVLAFAHEVLDRTASLKSKQKAGRRRDVLTRELGPLLLAMFMRYHSRAGRHSV